MPRPRRILARDGTILARDQRVLGLAVHYRYLEDPADPAWLRSQARRWLAWSREIKTRPHCRDDQRH